MLNHQTTNRFFGDVPTCHSCVLLFFWGVVLKECFFKCLAGFLRRLPSQKQHQNSLQKEGPRAPKRKGSFPKPSFFRGKLLVLGSLPSPLRTLTCPLKISGWKLGEHFPFEMPFFYGTYYIRFWEMI